MTNEKEDFLKFQQLTEQWSRETIHLSKHDGKNEAHQTIVAMGKDVVIPFIMYDWDQNPKMVRHWFHALYEFSGKVNLIPPRDRGKIIKMRSHWYKWCLDNGYKPYAPIQN